MTRSGRGRAGRGRTGRRRAWAGLAAAIGTGALCVVPVAGQAGAVGGTGSATTVSGTWKITTTDCAFGCTLTVKVLQSGHVLTSPGDPNVYGSISGKVMTLADAVAPGTLWECSGNLKKGHTRWRGIFTAVSGTTTTTGTFTAKRA